MTNDPQGRRPFSYTKSLREGLWQCARRNRLLNLLGRAHFGGQAGPVELTRFRRHISASSQKLLECQRVQQILMSYPRTEIYNVWHLYQAAILGA